MHSAAAAIHASRDLMDVVGHFGGHVEVMSVFTGVGVIERGPRVFGSPLMRITLLHPPVP